MSELFKNSCFPIVQIDDFYTKELTLDMHLRHFAPLSLKNVYNADFRDKCVRLEYVLSYLMAAEVLAKELDKRLRESVRYVFYNYSLNLEIFYLCRHCLELTMKSVILECGGKPKAIHNLKRIWDSLLEYTKNIRDKDDVQLFKNMGAFINMMDRIDTDGLQFRYPDDNGGMKDTLVESSCFYWVNGMVLVSHVNAFVLSFWEAMGISSSSTDYLDISKLYDMLKKK